ncbi:MAG TPA: 6-carboxytetrahydropterin synthase [Ignavibacteriaceae bacterium]|nr:6-carboxytetrahydropterin synthase [Ignavibacteriaceae bacterium]
MVYVTRRETFNAAHRVYNPELSNEENFNLFGKCSNPNWHGHNYVIEVVVAGNVNPQTGYVIDLKLLKDIIRENVTEKVDHKNLNLEVDFMKGVQPSAENICIKIWEQLINKIPSGKLFSVKLYETENNYFEYKGD